MKNIIAICLTTLILLSQANGNKSEYRSFANQFNIDQIAFFHESGLPTITYDIIPTSDTMMNHSMVCKIFKNNSLTTEISVPMLKDATN